MPQLQGRQKLVQIAPGITAVQTTHMLAGAAGAPPPPLCTHASAQRARVHRIPCALLPPPAAAAPVGGVAGSSAAPTARAVPAVPAGAQQLQAPHQAYAQPYAQVRAGRGIALAAAPRPRLAGQQQQRQQQARPGTLPGTLVQAGGLVPVQQGYLQQQGLQHQGYISVQQGGYGQGYDGPEAQLVRVAAPPGAMLVNQEQQPVAYQTQQQLLHAPQQSYVGPLPVPRPASPGAALPLCLHRPAWPRSVPDLPCRCVLAGAGAGH
jgi:hypothetical protein